MLKTTIVGVIYFIGLTVKIFIPIQLPAAVPLFVPLVVCIVVLEVQLYTPTQCKTVTVVLKSAFSQETHYLIKAQTK